MLSKPEEKKFTAEKKTDKKMIINFPIFRI